MLGQKSKNLLISDEWQVTSCPPIAQSSSALITRFQREIPHDVWDDIPKAYSIVNQRQGEADDFYFHAETQTWLANSSNSRM